MTSMPMYNPTHPGESIREAILASEWTVTEAAKRLGVARNTLSRLVHADIGISPAMALALEGIGWSNADFWMRRQAGYDLAQARRAREAAA